MPMLARMIVGGALLCVPAALAALALPRTTVGLRIEPAHAIIDRIVFGERLPLARYRAAAAAFGVVPRENGRDLAQRAEFEALAANGAPDKLSAARRDIAQALVDEPGNARSWTLLCEIEADKASPWAVGCLDAMFRQTPYDWFTADRRMMLAAYEWPFLDETLRNAVTGLVLPMWHTDHWSNNLTLRYVLIDLSNSENGQQLLRAGFAENLDALRGFNRWALQERIDGR